MTEPLRLLHIIPYFNPAWAYGGSVRVASELCARLAARGHAVTVLTTDTLDAHHRLPAGEALVDGVRVIRSRNLSNWLAWKRLFMPLGFGAGLSHYLKEHDFVHLHEYRSLPNALALPALRQTGVPYVVMPHGSLPAELGRTAIKHVYDALVGRRLLEGACRLHALTEMERQQYLDLGLPDSRIAVIPNGLDLDAFNLPADGDTFRQQFEIPADVPLIGYLGRLNRIKGLDFLIDAFAELLRQRPDAFLAIVGPDDGEQAALEAQIARLGIGRSVRFIGMLADAAMKAAAYRAFDLYVLPSRYESLPTTVLEALYNGTRCIVTERCGLAGELSGNRLAGVVSFGDVGSLAHQMLSYQQKPDSPDEAERRRGYITEHFRWDEIIDQWVDLYQCCREIQ